MRVEEILAQRETPASQGLKENESKERQESRDSSVSVISSEAEGEALVLIKTRAGRQVKRPPYLDQ